MMRLAATLLLSGLATAGLAQALDPVAPGPVLALDQAYAAADRASPALQSADAGLRAAAAGQTIAGLRPNPTLGIAVENVAGPAPYRQFDSSETTASVEFPIELGRKRTARLGVADAQADRARIDAAVADADLHLVVTQTYVAALAAERRVLTARALAQIARDTEAAAGIRVQAGSVSPIDDTRADLLRINAEVEVEKQERLAATARANLGRLIGRPVSEALDVDWFHRMPPAGPSRPIDVDDTLELAIARADTRTAAAQIGLARSQRVPDIAISAGARRIAQSNDTVAVLGLALPLNLMTNGRAAIAQATAERDRADAQQRLARIQAGQAIADAQAEVENTALTARTANGPAYRAAAETARIARLGYRDGKLDQIALLEAERSLNEVRLGAIDALAAYHVARANLDRLTAPVSAHTR